MVKLLTVFALALALAAIGAVAWQTYAPTMHTPTQVKIGEAVVAVEVADTPEERARGLSGRPALSLGSGMLFVFEEEGEWGIWMKDMHFAIDIIWAAGDGSVVATREHATPDSYPQVFRPGAPARFVLEVPAGFVQSHGVAVGQRIVIE